MSKVRADLKLVTDALAPTRAIAQALIMRGDVFIGEVRVEKPGQLIDPNARVLVRGSGPEYVSRGGHKLAGALRAVSFNPSGMRCLDVGASTGGFTDCLLQHGAAQVFAVDVGYGQLADKLRADERVTVMERTNAKTLTEHILGSAVDLTVVDASFIGLAKLLPAIYACTRPGGKLLALIKPQFEVGKKEAQKANGVIRDAKLRQAAIDHVVTETKRLGFIVHQVVDSVLPGPKGNVEAFIFAERSVLMPKVDRAP